MYIRTKLQPKAVTCIVLIFYTYRSAAIVFLQMFWKSYSEGRLEKLKYEIHSVTGTGTTK